MDGKDKSVASMQVMNLIDYLYTKFVLFFCLGVVTMDLLVVTIP